MYMKSIRNCLTKMHSRKYLHIYTWPQLYFLLSFSCLRFDLPLSNCGWCLLQYIFLRLSLSECYLYAYAVTHVGPKADIMQDFFYQSSCKYSLEAKKKIVKILNSTKPLSFSFMRVEIYCVRTFHRYAYKLVVIFFIFHFLFKIFKFSLKIKWSSFHSVILCVFTFACSGLAARECLTYGIDCLLHRPPHSPTYLHSCK